MVMQTESKNLMSNLMPKLVFKKHATHSSPQTKRQAPSPPVQQLSISVDKFDQQQQQQQQQQMSLFSGSSSTSSTNYKKTLTSASSTSSREKNKSTLGSVSSPCSTGSSESVVISSSSCSPKTRKFFNNLAFENNANDYFEEILIDESCDHREMAIDCPDTFVPEFKTKPCYPPPQPQPNVQNKLLTFINQSYSSLQFIDEESRSKLNVTDSPVSESGKSSAGKLLFEKQKDGLVNNAFVIEEESCASSSSSSTSRSCSSRERVPTPKPTETKLELVEIQQEQEKTNEQLDMLVRSFDNHHHHQLDEHTELDNTLGLYNKFISLCAKYDFRPASDNVTHLITDFDTLVMIIKYDNGVIDLYNGYNRDYVSPTRENASLSLLQEVRINDKVALMVQRSVAFVSTVNPSVNNDLRNCYRLAIASGPLLNQFTLPHSQIPQFTPNCLVIASDKTTSGPLVPYYVNMSIDNQFTDDLLDPNSANYFRTRFRIEKFITDSLQVDNLFVKNFQLLSLSPGSVVSISGISLENAGLEKQITDALVKGNTDFLPVMKDRIFVTSSLDDSSTTTATTATITTTTTTVNMTIIDSTTPPTTIFANTTTPFVNETTYSTNTTTSMTNATTNAINKTMETEVATSTANVTIELDFFAVEFKVDMTYSENLKNKSSTEYNSFVTLLDNFIKSGFLANGQIDALKKWNVEDLRQGSIVALTSMSVEIAQDEDKVGFVKRNLESGNKEILPIESIEIRSFDVTTKQTTPSTTIGTTSSIGKKDDDSRSVSAVAIVVPIVCVFFIVIIIIIGIFYFRQRRKARNSYILQTRDRNGAFDAASRASEIPRNPPRFSSEDELSRHSQSNLSARFKSANESPPNIDSLANQVKRDSGPPTYSMTDKASDQFKDIPLGSNDKNEKIQMNEINLNERDKTVLNYDTSDIDDTRPNLGTIIKSSNNPLFQMDE